mmetsp:Transcript_14192/g.36062  ORF Transcript_14192/g.36062 Transcript_14192/m.36062 type:complete len:94 (+) Transcript_14192:173-454(+)
MRKSSAVMPMDVPPWGNDASEGVYDGVLKGVLKDESVGDEPTGSLLVRATWAKAESPLVSRRPCGPNGSGEAMEEGADSSTALASRLSAGVCV